GLHQARSAGKNEIWCGSGDDDKVDVLRINTRILYCCPTRFNSKVAGSYAFVRQVTLSYAGTLCNPGVGGFDLALGQLCSQLVVGNNTGRQITARTDYPGMGHERLPDARVRSANGYTTG